MIDELQNAKRNIISIASIDTHGAERAFVTGPSLIVAVVTLLFAAVQANGQAAPKPPAGFCIEGASNCGPQIVSDNANGKKWNPGHYLRTLGNHAEVDQAAYVARVLNQLGKVNDSPEIKGALVGYAWGGLEPTVGNYDWEPIYTHLNYLAARGKKLIVMVLVKCFDSDCTHLAPSDMASEVFVNTNNSKSAIVEVWEEKNMDVFIALMQAFAAEFDGNPALEMIMGTESGPSIQGTKPVNFSNQALATQLKRMYSAQAAAFTSTNVIANVNFLGGEVSGLIEHAFQVGAGRGLADIFDSAGSVVFRGECSNNDCGVRDYRGLVPHFGIVSPATLGGKHSPDTDTPPEVIVYGMTNAITHYVWISNGTGEDSWANVIKAIGDAPASANAPCPGSYTQGCK